MQILKDILEIFFPFRCHICRQQTNFNQVLCGKCCKSLKHALHKPELVSDTVCDFGVYTLSQYNSLVADVIRLIKYRPSKKILKELEQIIANNNLLNSWPKEKKIFIPVPLSSKRLNSRGFNQAERLARTFAEVAGGIYSPALIRSRHARPQAECDAEERLVNLDDAFALADALNKNRFSGKSLVIVDDVATTGTTIKKCYEQLRQLKPSSICALVVTHSFLQKESRS
ncbi:MAG: ComF family protein [Candidatus Rifleibacteriota bacterium]